jgi:dihydroorotate dehydrogenase (fumarate)
MANLATTYMGIPLKNPLILGACNLSSKPETVKKLEEAGIAAIVYKSLFEEQIQLESLQLDEDLHEYEERHAEMLRLFPTLEHAGPREHLLNIKKLKESVNIPVIASLNAVYEVSWVEYAEELEKTGVDALEINLYSVPGYFEVAGSSIEEKQLEVIKAVKQAVKIPVSVKISPFYTNTLNFIKKVDEAGANAYVLFNRFFQPDIDINTEEFYFPWELTSEKDRMLSLRYAGLLYGNLDGDICSSRGIYTAEDVVRNVLAGANVVQIVSTVYKNQPEVIPQILDGISKWMDGKKYNSLSDFRGKLSRKNLKDPFAYRRAQYIDILSKSEEIFKKYPMV